MPFFAKHWFQRLCLGGAGVLISSFGPSQVPEKWQPVLLWLGVALAVFAALIWPLIDLAVQARRKFPERHKGILQELAAPLATVQEQALTYGQRDMSKMLPAKAQAEELISQIPYDNGTVETVRDFLQACTIASDTHNTADEAQQARQDVYRISPDLFRYLHNGKSVDRRKIDLPDWCKDRAATSKSPILEIPPSAQEANYPVARDVEIAEALVFACSGDWGGTPEALESDEVERWEDRKREVEQLAADGKLTIWGKPYQHNSVVAPLLDQVHRPISADFWHDHMIDWLSLVSDDPKTEERNTGDKSGEQYHELMVSRAQFIEHFGGKK